MLAEERYSKILEMLNESNSVKVSTLIKLFKVSIETVRRDLEYLEKKGLLKRVYGGAVLEKIDTKQRIFNSREKENIDEKTEIGNIVSNYIEEGQSIAVDVSTTNLEVIRVLKKKFKHLTIITNSLIIANELTDMPDYMLILTGGIYRKEESSITGDICISNIGQFHVDTSLISASGISLKAGITDFGFPEVEAKKKMIDIAQNVFVVSDSSKFDTVSLLKVCNLDRVDMIITDPNINENIAEKYEKAGVTIIRQ